MGDRLATIDMCRKVGKGCCGGAGSPLGHHLTQCGVGRGLPLYQVARVGLLYVVYTVILNVGKFLSFLSTKDLAPFSYTYPTQTYF